MKISALLAGIIVVLTINTAYAITEIQNAQQAEKMQLQSMGVIGASVAVDTLDEAVAAIRDKAEKQNASYFRVIGVQSYDTSPYWRVSAEIYK
ncbi:DUF1471 domain-containing protein [Budvicia diplopodorum]|uniref:DUF1471 domain-containing protein n=1 Tax=Budvicia diplopodorum TaxID=1119056 RepID=UPI001358AF3A|nr:DUF1471 domain-containing protein [Budvicia diplopodorum]